ncbi:unnamed protein product [Mytilus edulis]|uniref:Fibronectin type-III domain-containing protein n=1 Tax=Mytilus edulis TaxID=6550 RepID=A0A8S3V7E2_MYTED|nr:unnamed protein product [Mytilus edulis]
MKITEYRIYITETSTDKWKNVDFWAVEPDTLYCSKPCSDILPSTINRFRISTYVNNSYESKQSDETSICVPGDQLCHDWTEANIFPSTTYRFRISTCFDKLPESKQSDEQTYEVGGPPSDFTVTKEADSLKFRWSKPANLPMKITEYRIYITETSTDNWKNDDFWAVEPDTLYCSKPCSDILPSTINRFRISTYVNNSYESKQSDETSICVPGG